MPIKAAVYVITLKRSYVRHLEPN